MVIALPWPPSVNKYYRVVRGRPIISREGRIYRGLVAMEMLGRGKIEGRLKVVVEAHPPDGRRRDLDNLNKALLDALQNGGAYEDDSQIDDLRVIRMPPAPKLGHVIVEITQIKQQRGL